MTVEQMCEFAVLAEQRNYLVAADLLFTTQATLSRHIMAMEEELGVQLFNRTTKRIELTPYGTRFLHYAQQARKIQQAYRAELAEVREKQSGVFTVGYNAVSILYHVTDYLIQFMSEHPELEFKVFEADSETLLNAVRDGSCEIAVYQENPFERPKGVDSYRLSSDTMVAILPDKHPLAKAKQIELSQLKKDGFVTSIVTHEPACIFIEACRRAGFEPNIVYPGVIANSMSELIAKGSCVGLDWKAAAQIHHVDGVSLVPVVPPLYSHSLMICKKENLSVAGKQMVAFLKNVWGNKNEI